MQFEFSAGGIVYKHPSTTGAEKVILLAQHAGHHGWIFPKGHIEKGETKEDAAVREVLEETGVLAHTKQSYSPVTYWYVREGEKIKKTVYYFLMEYLSGDITKHDDEMENVQWILINKVMDKLTYKSDKQVWETIKNTLT